MTNEQELNEYREAAEAALSEQDAANSAYETLAAIGAEFVAEFKQAQVARRQVELRWLKDLRQYKGIYEDEVLARIGKHRSKIFVRKTRVKIKTLDARMMDLLFPAGSVKNWDVKPTAKPSVSPEQRAMIIAELKAKQVPPSQKALEAAIRDFAEKAAARMSTTIKDQLMDTKYRDLARKVIHSGNLYGTGVLKAPLVERKVRERFVAIEQGWKIVAEQYVAPFLEYVPLWRWFPDMNAVELAQCRYVYELHSLTRSRIADLAARKSFNGEALRNYVIQNPNGATAIEHYDSQIRLIGDRIDSQTRDNGMYDIIERWGYIDATKLELCGVPIPAERRHETFFANVWLLPNGTVIRAALQPINGVTWPYHLYSFDKDETSIFAEGAAAVMRDDQDMINASTRMMFDHAAITAGPQFEVDVRQALSQEGIDESFPFKVWLKTGELPNVPMVRVMDIPSSLDKINALREISEQNADEVLALPKFMNGDNPVNGAAGTMGGMSMLMGAVNINVKDLVASYDDGVTNSFIAALYKWNMQFNPDNAIKGDYDVFATGAASLVAREVRSQQLTQFAGTLQPEERPLVKWDKVVQAKAESLECVDVVKSDEEIEEDAQSPAAQQQAQLAAAQQQLTVAQLEKMVAKLAAEAEKIAAQALQMRVNATRDALEAGALAVTQPAVAPAGDAILQSAGWRDAPPPKPAAAPAAEAVPA